MGVSYGMLIGVMVGLLTGQLVICLSLGIICGTLVQGFTGAKKNKPNA